MTESSRIILERIENGLKVYLDEYEKINNELREIAKEQKEKTCKLEELKKQYIKMNRKTLIKLLPISLIIILISLAFGFFTANLALAPFILVIGYFSSLIPIILSEKVTKKIFKKDGHHITLLEIEIRNITRELERLEYRDEELTRDMEILENKMDELEDIKEYITDVSDIKNTDISDNIVEKPKRKSRTPGLKGVY